MAWGLGEGAKQGKDWGDGRPSTASVSKNFYIRSFPVLPLELGICLRSALCFQWSPPLYFHLSSRLRINALVP